MNRRQRLTRWMVPALLLLVVLVTAPPAPAAGPSPLTIRSIDVRGTLITITVTNTSGEARSAWVLVRVFVAGGWQDLNARITVPGGGSAETQSSAQSTPVTVLPLGVVLDDGVPF